MLYAEDSNLSKTNQTSDFTCKIKNKLFFHHFTTQKSQNKEQIEIVKLYFMKTKEHFWITANGNL